MTKPRRHANMQRGGKVRGTRKATPMSRRGKRPVSGSVPVRRNERMRTINQQALALSLLLSGDFRYERRTAA